MPTGPAAVQVVRAESLIEEVDDYDEAAAAAAAAAGRGMTGHAAWEHAALNPPSR